MISRDVIFIDEPEEVQEKTYLLQVDESTIEAQMSDENSEEYVVVADHEDKEADYIMYVESVPKTYNEAMTDRNAEKWKEAMKSEYESLMENHTWILADMPMGNNAIKNKWVFAVKKDIEGNVVRHKARLVAKGYLIPKMGLNNKVI